MNYHFEKNEFTSWELLEYFKIAYGGQLNGAPFTATNLHNWIRQKKVADLYGGFRILQTKRYKELGNLLVITLDGFTREEMHAQIGNPLSYLQETKNRKRKLDVVPKPTRPRKQRTKLYYQLLQKAGKQWTKQTLEQSTLPEFWKEAGGKGNQKVKERISKKKSTKSNQ